MFKYLSTVSFLINYFNFILCFPQSANDIPIVTKPYLINNDPQYSSEPNLTTLQFVALVTRHGSRTPLKTWPSDPYPYTNPKYWPDGVKQLTNIGKEQLYHTGQLLRVRYQGFIDPIYKPNSCEITYNPYDRDFMSAACLSAGMYPPDGPQLWNPDLLWQPVVLKQRDFDICDLGHSKVCPKFMKLQKEQIMKYNQNSSSYKDLIEYVSESTGSKFSKLSDMFDIYDTLLMQVENGYKLPPWTKKVFPYKLQSVAPSYLAEIYGGTKDIVQLAAGPELKYISERLNLKGNGTYGDVSKFYIEAAHDCTLIALLRALGYQQVPLEIKTGSFVIFELHNINSEYIVKVIYFKTSYDEEPELINVEGCQNPCKLSNFNQLVDQINPLNWHEACKLN